MSPRERGTPPPEGVDEKKQGKEVERPTNADIEKEVQRCRFDKNGNLLTEKQRFDNRVNVVDHMFGVSELDARKESETKFSGWNKEDFKTLLAWLEIDETELKIKESNPRKTGRYT